MTIQSDDRPVGAKLAALPARRFHNELLSFVLAQLILLPTGVPALQDVGCSGTSTSGPGQYQVPAEIYGVATATTAPPFPTSTPRPERTGDIGFVNVSGHVYRVRDGLHDPVEGAFVRSNGHETTTDADGRFQLSIFVHDSYTYSFRAELEGVFSEIVYLSGIDLAFRHPVIELLIPGARTITPTKAPPPATPTPFPGDLGVKQVSGMIFDAAIGLAAPIANASLKFQRSSTIGTGSSGEVDAPAGEYAFSLFLRDTDTIVVEASADQYRPASRRIGGYELWIRPSLSIGLTQRGTCPGDCNQDGRVSISEVVRAVGIALATIDLTTCRIVDTDGDSMVGIAELTRAVRFGLHGCS